ncbi:nucleoside deaminase [Aerococcaceae bacterium DSM 111022]|nr:nucleoside deaminase [Aerococcaceae bacterium DSM 111022]
MITDIDKKHLKRCIELAQEALDKGDQPFGSVLVSADGEILFEDHNHVSNGDHTQHPEFNIARWAGQNMTEQERKVATVYTSGEHCPMCAAAHGAVKLGRIVYASSSKQLTKWHKEFGVQTDSRVISRPIEDVIQNTPVDGPVNDLAEEVKALQQKYHAKYGKV